ncbi:MAG: diiron oxygenase [Myxococcales bacterium]
MITTAQNETHRYARAVDASKRARWDIDADVIRGRHFERGHKFLPDGLSFAHELPFLRESERIFLSQVQGRTYANLFGLVERSVNATVLQLTARHLFGDQVALEALVRFSDEELKHQELFRRIELLAAEAMPEGYRFMLDANEVAGAVLAKPAWSVLALVLMVELYTQSHYKQSIAKDDQLSPFFQDVFRFHWMEESQHAVLDELEWLAENQRIDAAQRERAIDGLIELVGAVDGMLQIQSDADAGYFLAHAGRSFVAAEQGAVRATFLKAYRYQYILSGVRDTRFPEVLRGLIDAEQFGRVVEALAPLM